MKRIISALLCFVMIISLGTAAVAEEETDNMKIIYLAGGCFWGTQKFFDQFDGVVETEVGYANGPTENPNDGMGKKDKEAFTLPNQSIHVL